MFNHMGNTEVRNFGNPLEVEHDVRRFDVPVDDALLMGVIKGMAGVNNNFQYFS